MNPFSSVGLSLTESRGRTVTVNRGHKGILSEKVEHLHKFRSEHPCKRVDVTGVEREYISCGNGSEVLLLLTGGLRVAEAAFRYILVFEDTCRVIVPTYPPLGRIGESVDGVVAVLDAEQAPQAFVPGQSYGGAVAQVLTKRYPWRAKKVVLSGMAPLILVSWKKHLNDLVLVATTLLDSLARLSVACGRLLIGGLALPVMEEKCEL